MILDRSTTKSVIQHLPENNGERRNVFSITNGLFSNLTFAVADVEESEEAKEPPPVDVVDLCHETFQKTAEYLRGELEG